MTDTIPIDFTPRCRVLLPETRQLELFLVGVGGTGSALVDSLARILYHAKQKGLQVKLTLIDPDKIEAGNYGRQRFCQAELGQKKALSLALRYNAAFGLDIRAIPEAFHQEMVQSPRRHTYAGHDAPATRLLIGCVDNAVARQKIAETVTAAEGRTWWLDMGNATHNGNIYIGNATQFSQIRVDEPLGIVNGLPSPAKQNPALLKPDLALPAAVSCAELIQGEEQALCVNTFMAAIAAEYCCQWILKRELAVMHTAFTLEPPAMQSQPVTLKTILQAFPQKRRKKQK